MADCKIFIMGHPEYDRVTLDGEYKRDINKGLPIDIPKNYYKDNDLKTGLFFCGGLTPITCTQTG